MKLAIGVFIAVIVLAGITFFVFRTPPFEKNEELYKIVKDYNAKAAENQFTQTDLANLKALLAPYPQADSYMEEAQWLLDRNATEHTSHTLYWLSEYILTGEEEVCVAHEMSHILLNIEYQDYERAQKNLIVAKAYKEQWTTKVTGIYKRFPQYYPKFNEMMAAIDESIMRLDNQDYGNETQTKLQFIEQYEVC